MSPHLSTKAPTIATDASNIATFKKIAKKKTKSGDTVNVTVRHKHKGATNTKIEMPTDSAKVGESLGQKTYGQMTRRKPFCDACKHNATKNSTSELICIDSVKLIARPPPLTEEQERDLTLKTPASAMRLSKKFLLRGAAMSTLTQIAVAQALTPLAQFSKRKTVTSRCFVAAKASQMALSHCRSIGSIDVESRSLAEIVVEAVASDRSKFPRRDPLVEFDDDAFDEAVTMASEFDLSYQDVQLACVRLLTQNGKWTNIRLPK
jgi:hypothetical protein